jgi:hypothetical protein
VSVYRPRDTRYAAVRGTQADVLRYVRGRDYVGPVKALGELVGRPEWNTWIAIVRLVERGLIRAENSGDVANLRVTKLGRQIRL